MPTVCLIESNDGRLFRRASSDIYSSSSSSSRRGLLFWMKRAFSCVSVICERSRTSRLRSLELSNGGFKGLVRQDDSPPVDGSAV